MRKQQYKKGRPRWGRLLAYALLLGLMIWGLVRLAGYGIDYLASRRASEQLRQAYYGEPSDPPSDTPTQTPAPSPIPATATPIPATTPLPTSGPRLPVMRYSNNPNLQISSRFRTLRAKSQYIVGWLSIPGLLDEAVAQRDNT